MFISTGIAQGQRLNDCFCVIEGHTSGVPLFAHSMENAGDLDPSHPSQTTVSLVVMENLTVSELLRVINSQDLI
jgi:hypothetical protein